MKKQSIKEAFGFKKPKEPRYVFSKKTQRIILKIQNYRCGIFGCKFRNSKLLEFDHIRRRSDNTIENCQALCPTHHRLKTKRDALKARISKTEQKKTEQKKKNKDWFSL